MTEDEIVKHVTFALVRHLEVGQRVRFGQNDSFFWTATYMGTQDGYHRFKDDIDGVHYSTSLDGFVLLPNA